MTAISQYTSLTTLASNDDLVIVDVSDTSMSPNGTTKKVTAAGLLPVDWLNVVTMYGADDTGVSDATTAINNALAAVPAGGGCIYLPAGTYLLNSSSALALATAGTVLRGDGPGATFIKIGASFAAAEAVNVTTASCEVRDLGIIGASSTVTSNPIANGIELTGAAHCRFENLWFQYVNGWCIESVAGSSNSNIDTMIGRITGRNCAAGIHVKGVTGTSFLGEEFLTDIQLQQIGAASGANQNLDGILIEDVSDILAQGVNIGIASGTTGSALHIKGICATVAITNPDVGATAASGVSAQLHIESSGNGSPSGITINGGSVEGGGPAIQIDAGTDITLNGVRAHQAYTDGLQVTGSATEVLAIGCSFAANNQSGGSAYDVNAGSMSGGNLRVIASRFESPIASSTAGSVPNSVSASSHAYFKSCFFFATATSPSNVFTGTPQQVTECLGYNPRGSVTAANGGTAGTSPYTPGTYQAPLMVIFTAINGMTQYSIGGTTVPTPAAGVPYYLGVRQTQAISWSGAAPTYQWFSQ